MHALAVLPQSMGVHRNWPHHHGHSFLDDVAKAGLVRIRRVDRVRRIVIGVMWLVHHHETLDAEDFPQEKMVVLCPDL